MKTVIQIALISVLAAASLAEPNRRAVINDPDGFSNIRAKASTNSAVVGTVKSGEEFLVEPSNATWWKVRGPNGESGFLHRSRISLSAPNSPPDRAGQTEAELSESGPPEDMKEAHKMASDQLARSYKQALADANTEEQRKLLIAAQRAWLAWHEAEARYRASKIIGSDQSPENDLLSELTELTHERAAQIDSSSDPDAQPPPQQLSDRVHAPAITGNLSGPPPAPSDREPGPRVERPESRTAAPATAAPELYAGLTDGEFRPAIRNAVFDQVSARFNSPRYAVAHLVGQVTAYAIDNHYTRLIEAEEWHFYDVTAQIKNANGPTSKMTLAFVKRGKKWYSQTVTE